ncbi:MAG: ATP-binding cassette domain-containing protein, partial [Alphaproteobacteria bacterium]
MNAPAIAVDIEVTRGAQTIGARFQADGGITVLFGPSGAGKTTVLEAIAGLLRPASGRIQVHGRVLFDAASSTDVALRQRRLGYLPQDMLLFPHRSVAGNLRFARAGRKADIARIARLCEIEPLMARRPAQLSGGEQRRVALARALAAVPELLLLDEPLAGLDPPRRQRLLGIIEQLRDGGGPPILYVGHFAEEAVRLADTAV